jgi:hypothetical protein
MIKINHKHRVLGGEIWPNKPYIKYFENLKRPKNLKSVIRIINRF